MRKSNFKSSVAFIAISVFLSITIAKAGEWVSLKPGSNKAEVTLVSSTVSQTVLKMTVNGFTKTEVTTPKGSAFVISASGTTPMLESANPDLPKIATSIIIPDADEMATEVIASSFIDYPGIQIAPSKGDFSRTIEPLSVPFTYSDVYSKNEFFPKSLTSMRNPFVLRDYRGQTVLFYPFQYNPVTKILRVYTELTVKIYAKSKNGVNQISRKAPVTKIDKEFAYTYTHLFKNGGNVINYDPVEEAGSMLIISHGAFMPAMAPFIEWKTRKGLKVEMVDIATIGNDDVLIKDYIQNYYNANSLKYVLLVGDVQQITSPTLSGGASDPSYGYLAGNDAYAEVFVGRFSAQTISDVEVQVQKSVQYEMNPNLNGNWYHKGIAIGSDQGAGAGLNGLADWEFQRTLIRAQELNYLYTAVDELYDGSQGGADAPGNPAPADMRDAINDGRSIITYCGHGGQNTCVTTNFSSSDIASLTNYEAWPFFWSVACVNGDFTNGTCIAESFLRANNAGQPTGCVATLMSSINQSWVPPMSGEYEMVSIFTEALAANIKRTFGGISVNGCAKMNDDYGTGGTSMTDTWHCFGDPSLEVRSNTPTQITAVHNAVEPLGISQFIINCNTDGALACISMNGEILGTAFINGGVATINFAAALSVIDTFQVTITGYNCKPYMADVALIAASGPYVICSANTINDAAGNNNGMPDFSENILLNLDIANLGIADANNVTAVLSTADTNITINVNTALLGTVATGGNILLNNVFDYTIASNVSDQHSVLFIITFTDSLGNIWTTNFSQLINAPKFEVQTITVNDANGGNGNGILEPGETADIMVTSKNVGHANSLSSTDVITTTSSFVTFNGNTSSAPGIVNTNSIVNSSFNVSLANNIVLGSLIDFNYIISTYAYLDEKTFYLSAGEQLEDFETNNFSLYPWSFGGNANWFTTGANLFQGVYCAQSGLISDNQKTDLIVTIDVLTDDSISFYAKVSSEANYDFLKFYVDADKQAEWSGSSNWQYNSYAIGAGLHTLKWSYVKDNTVASGDDAAWVDNISFPPFVNVISAVEYTTDEHVGFSIAPNPVKENALVNFILETPGLVTIKLIDAKGQTVKLIAGKVYAAGNHYENIITNDLLAGLYLCQITTAFKTMNSKVIIEK
jgi:hypothetical protein